MSSCELEVEVQGPRETHSLIDRMLLRISLMMDVRASLFFICSRWSLV